MSNIINGLVIGLVAIFILTIAVDVTDDGIKNNRGSATYNCPGYVDTTGQGLSYNASLDTNSAACSLNSSISPIYMLGAIVGILFLIIYGGTATSLAPTEFR